jgi:hypothetical protein
MVNLEARISVARPYLLALKYLDYKKYANPDAHVKVFNEVIKANGKTYEEYIINAFSDALREMTSYWCQNYMSKFPNCIFFELMKSLCKHHQKPKTKNIFTWSSKVSTTEILNG